MKKRLLALTLALVMVVAVFPTMANAETEIKIWVEGDYISMDVEPFIEEGRTLVPVRFVTEALGYEVTWHADEKKVTFTDGTNEIMMMIGSKDATLNGENVMLYKEPQIKEERTFVPVRDVAEKFGKMVDWDAETKTVIIGEGYFAEEKEDDIVDVALGNEDFSILVAALQKAELVETLQGEGPFTVFAPTNAAFEQLLMDLDVTAEELLAQPDLAKVLTYHVVSRKVMSTDLVDGMEPATVNGQTIMVDLTDGVMINDANVTTADLEATNGVIHVIDKVLVPVDFELQEVMVDDIVDVALGNEDFSILVAALQKAELVETLQGEGPFTVFAPTNAAFEQLLMDLDVTAEELLGQADLGKVLTYHVVSGKVMSTDLVDGMEPATVNGQTIMVDLTDGVKINDASVTTADLEATNGVIHVIDKVLVPADFELQ